MEATRGTSSHESTFSQATTAASFFANLFRWMPRGKRIEVEAFESLDFVMCQIAKVPFYEFDNLVDCV